jgi:tetratricopeptide (TPR) repeat protein
VVGGGRGVAPGIADRAPATPYVLAGLVLIFLSALTLMQARVYATPNALWPIRSSRIRVRRCLQYNYGISLLRQSDTLEPEEAAKALDESIEHFKRATEIQPTPRTRVERLGQALLLRGHVDESMAKFDRSIAINESASTLNLDPIMGRARPYTRRGGLRSRVGVRSCAWPRP